MTPAPRRSVADRSLLQGRVAIVTGAGNGIGRGEAIALAAHGASVVVNDLGVAVDGQGRATSPADRVVDAIRAAGGTAVANYDDIGDWGAAGRVVEQALSAFGRLDIVVNNAGFQIPGGLLDMREEAWDGMLRVHLKGTMAMMQHAARHWAATPRGRPAGSRSIINTTSPAGLPGDPGMPAYAAAKAGVAALTVGAALELESHGIRVNAVAPFGLTRLVDYNLGASSPAHAAPLGFDAGDPDNNAPLVVWLASDRSDPVTGQVFRSRGASVTHYEPWHPGVTVTGEERWEPLALGAAIINAVAQTRPPRRAMEPEIAALLGGPTRADT